MGAIKSSRDVNFTLLEGNYFQYDTRGCTILFFIFIDEEEQKDDEWPKMKMTAFHFEKYLHLMKKKNEKFKNLVSFPTLEQGFIRISEIGWEGPLEICIQ